MISHGSPPFLECSSAGDKRFSALYAKIRSRGGATIEEIHQAAKTAPLDLTGDQPRAVVR